MTGALTSYIDVAQVALYAFWIFFAGIVVYLLRENKREGYPLVTGPHGRKRRLRVQGWPGVPRPKRFRLRDGTTRMAPDVAAEAAATSAAAAIPASAWPGAPIVPVGDPMKSGLGPGAWASRRDIVDTTLEGEPRIVPLRDSAGFDVAGRDPDPRGRPVVGADGVVGGTVVDLWVDRSEMVFRYLEVDTGTPGGRPVLVPVNFCRINARSVNVRSILGSQFAGVPTTRHPAQVTFLEEERIMAYYGAGTLYATPDRQEPLL